MNKIIKFLYGRYGIDDLYKLFIFFYFLLFVINIFVKSNIISYIEILLIFIILFRSLSKNIRQRKKENDFYLNIKNIISKKFKLFKTIIEERNSKLYKRCPKCKNMLRLPLKKGTHTVKCPTCSNKFTVKCNRNEKIKVEIIK